ncbi:MAG: hypothetical protein ACOX4G_09570 [Limnochordia bacterium]
MNDLVFYDPVATEPLPNDDLDFQLVWLKMLEEQGAPPRLLRFHDLLVKVPVGPIPVLGSDQATGYASGVNVENCSVCRGRKGSCLCEG